jgi:hypothetical protein
MKLYTEEQVIKMLEVCILSDKYPDVLTLNDVVKTQTPIQLPSDEEIDKADNEKDRSKHYAFMRGAIWMRDKIEGGNK